jgi:hypothetical protein
LAASSSKEPMSATGLPNNGAGGAYFQANTGCPSSKTGIATPLHRGWIVRLDYNTSATDETSVGNPERFAETGKT